MHATRKEREEQEEVDIVVVENVKYKISLICVVRTLDTNTLWTGANAVLMHAHSNSLYTAMHTHIVAYRWQRRKHWIENAKKYTTGRRGWREAKWSESETMSVEWVSEYLVLYTLSAFICYSIQTTECLRQHGTKIWHINSRAYIQPKSTKGKMTK